MSSNTVIQGMGQQMKMLDGIDEMIKKCREENLCGEQDEAEILHLEKYCANMRSAANTALRLAKKLKEIEDKHKEAEEARHAKEGKEEEEKKKTQKKTQKSPKKSPPVEKTEDTEDEEEDLDFLS